MPIVKPGDVPVVMTEYGPWQALNAPLGITGFGANVFCAGAGDDIDMEHHEAESNQEELYVVLAGRAAFTIDGVEHEVGVGTIMGAPDPAALRSIRALEDGTRILCIGAQPGTGDEGYGAFVVPL